MNGPDPLAHHLFTQACNNAWANHRLLGACSALTQVDFEAPRTSFFPSIRATLNHILSVDRYYVDAMERSLAAREPNPDPMAFFEPEAPFDTCAALRAEQAAIDGRLIDLCRGLDAGRLRRSVGVPRRGRVSLEPWPRLLAHVFQHQTHHRGQVHAMLAGTAITPPQLDEFFSVDEAPLRAGDFAVLGWSETDVWSPPRTVD